MSENSKLTLGGLKYYSEKLKNFINNKLKNLNYNDLSNTPNIYDGIKIGDTMLTPQNNSEKLTIIAGDNISIDGDNTNDTITISSVGGSVPDGVAYVTDDGDTGTVDGDITIGTAELVRYSNMESGLVAKNVQEAIDQLTTEVNTSQKIAKGKNQARVFQTTEKMYEWLSNVSNKGVANVGDNLYIIDIGVPDWWISEVLTTPNSDGRYYNIAQLETQKVDLTTLEGQISALDTDITALENQVDTINSNLALSCGTSLMMSTTEQKACITLHGDRTSALLLGKLNSQQVNCYGIWLLVVDKKECAIIKISGDMNLTIKEVKVNNDKSISVTLNENFQWGFLDIISHRLKSAVIL